MHNDIVQSIFVLHFCITFQKRCHGMYYKLRRIVPACIFVWHTMLMVYCVHVLTTILMFSLRLLRHSSFFIVKLEVFLYNKKASTKKAKESEVHGERKGYIQTWFYAALQECYATDALSYTLKNYRCSGVL